MFTEIFQGLLFHALHNAHREVCQLNQPYLLLQNCVICVHKTIRQILTRHFFLIDAKYGFDLEVCTAFY